ncbi:hypothetical protein RND71_004410 [Anisodus tanguticus]|uniref:DUF7036 domain-containing protein n=1 Tax=Anisodus tanguticus TaxID=243964 RepID=A0AAE1VXB2_9SOLA|nr:hypothetical protein RND71_004410 [Anisodus tanguticus]
MRGLARSNLEEVIASTCQPSQSRTHRVCKVRRKSLISWICFGIFGGIEKENKECCLAVDCSEEFGVLVLYQLKIMDNILQLADDIFDEISVSNTKVDIISLENITGSNITEVVFAVDFETAPLFGDPFSFDVLKFRGGITVSPKQSGFPMQQVQILFNFTLNFSIDEIQDNFHELKSQLKSGLHLSSYENLYMSLTSRRGSTVDPPTNVQCKVLLAVGMNPSTSRLKQLAHTIGSNSGNLGLNNTVFGRVKQVSLSSFLPHSRVSNSGSPSPSPAPLPHPHHHHHHNRDSTLAPAISPAPKVEKGGSISRKVSPVSAPVFAPAPVHHKRRGAQPPCHFGRFPKKANRHHPHMVPARAPVPAPHYSLAASANTCSTSYSTCNHCIKSIAQCSICSSCSASTKE